jgi:hypothetical protein
MPSIAGSEMTSSCSRRLAVVTASASAPTRLGPGSSASSGAIVEIVAALATSPAACPPMPSATASRCGPAYAESSFPARRRPTSDRTAYLRASVVCAVPERSCPCLGGRDVPGPAPDPGPGFAAVSWRDLLCPGRCDHPTGAISHGGNSGELHHRGTNSTASRGAAGPQGAEGSSSRGGTLRPPLDSACRPALSSGSGLCHPVMDPAGIVPAFAGALACRPADGSC